MNLRDVLRGWALEKGLHARDVQQLFDELGRDPKSTFVTESLIPIEPHQKPVIEKYLEEIFKTGEVSHPLVEAVQKIKFQQMSRS